MLLTLAPARIGNVHLERLRHSSISDEEITIATQVVAYFNYINRVADGLGVDPEAWMNDPPRDVWEHRRAKDYLETNSLARLSED